MTLAEKIDACREIIRQCRSVLVAFSAGVDSTFLLALSAETLGADHVLAAMGVSEIFPHRDLTAGRELARLLGVELVEVRVDHLAEATFTSNPPQRCYHCKAAMIGHLRHLAERRGLAEVLTGANADDTGDHRPGLRAGTELGVVRPLLQAGLTKQDIRTASRAMGLDTWDKPSMACLASRIPYGQPITSEKLRRIERAEEVLAEMGYRQYRVRDHEAVARIELPPADLPRAIRDRDAIAAALRALGYTFVALDLEGYRSGSLNETLTGDAGGA